MELLLEGEDELEPGLRQITGDILSACIEVHKTLGPGYQELVYENALAVEFTLRGIPFVRQMRFPIDYKGTAVGEGRLDLLVADTVVVELKAVETMNALFTAQVISYLKATGRHLALLINFNVRRLKDGIKRIAY